MNANAARAILAVALVALATIARADETEPPVAVNVEGLRPQVAERVRAHAAQGETALRRYLERTRHIHEVRIEDVRRNQEPKQVAAEMKDGEAPEPKLAQREGD